MDAFAVSICKGLAFKQKSALKAMKIGLYFGVFQALMPFIGYILGSNFSNLVSKIDYIIAFLSLSIIGVNMIKESFEEDEVDGDLSLKTMLVLSVATSIDALVMGVTFAFLKINIFRVITIIGLTTFIFSIFGVLIGNIVGKRLGNKANFFGGLVLIIIGLKILFEHFL